MYTIKELADLAGVTTRTLRYYDQVGILQPAARGDNGYRYYDRGNLLTLQQILFFREMDLPVKEIQHFLLQPDFEILSALRHHQAAIQAQILRYQGLLETITETIQDIKGEQQMTPERLFNGFDERKYQKEARQRWGELPQYQESQQRWDAYTADQKDQVKKLGQEIIQRMVTENPNAKPDDQDVQAAVEEYYHYLNTYFYQCDLEFLRELAEMWVQDPRFAVNYERIREGGADFVRLAVHHFCDHTSADK